MRASPEFIDLTKLFFQDIDFIFDNERGFLSFVVRHIPESHKENLRCYLSEITSDRLSDTDLKKLWAASAAEIEFRDASQLRDILRRLQRQM
jgi:hypothetical protein